MSIRAALSVGAAAVILLAVSACGSSSSDQDADSAAPALTTKAKACPGEPVVVGQITSLEGPAPRTEMHDGVKAAAKEVNRTCAAGRPIKLVFCDDAGEPSAAGDCGREIIAAKPVAIVGSGGSASNNYEPMIQQDNGIPSIGNFAADPTELVAPTSFPFYNGLERAALRAATTHAAGAKSVSVIIPDNPNFQTQLPTFRKVLNEFGVKVDRFVTVPADATDLAQYASQASKSESIMILPDDQTPGLLRELANTGITPKNKVITAPTLSQKEINELGSGADGLLMASTTVPPNDTSNEGVAQAKAELNAAGIKADLDVYGLVAWRSMHVTADIIKDLPNPTKETVIKALNKYSFAPPEAAPVDFSKPAFPEIPFFEQFRIFSREFTIWNVKNGKIGLAVDGFVDPYSKFELNN